MRAPPIQPHIEFIHFNLSDFLNGGAQVVLQRIRCNTSENIHQTIVTNQRKEGLFIIQGVPSNDPRRGVGDFDLNEAAIGLDGPLPLQ